MPCRIQINPRFASIYGVKRNELLERLNNHDADLQRPEIDTLLIFLHR